MTTLQTDLELIPIGGMVLFDDPAFGRATEDDLATINARAPKALSRDELFIVPSVPSTQTIDSYMTKMADSTLRNYAQDASDGVAVMNMHATGGFLGGGELPVGRSFSGSFDEAAKLTRTLHYIVRGYNPNGAAKPGTDDVIRAIEAGVLTDLSVGFYLGRDGNTTCSICNADTSNWWDSECTHVPGKEYNVDSGRQLCFDWINNAHLREYSHVYKGATPGSAIQAKRVERLFAEGKASRADIGGYEDRAHRLVVRRFQGLDLERGALPKHETPVAAAGTPWDGSAETAAATPRDLRVMSAWMDGDKADTKAGYKFPHHQASGNHAVVKAGVDNAVGRVEHSDIPEDHKAGVLAHLRHHQEQIAKAQAGSNKSMEGDMNWADLLARFQITATSEISLDEAVRLLTEKQEQDGRRAVTELQQRLAAQEPKVKLGQAYLDRVIEENVQAGVRAFGNDFNVEAQRSAMQTLADPVQIEQQTKNFELAAGRTFGQGANPATSERTSVPGDHGRDDTPKPPAATAGTAQRFIAESYRS